MNHLTIDEVLDFVSLTEMNSESIKLSATVNGHIRKCEKCLQLVRPSQMICDEFSRLSTNGDFKGFISDHISALKEKTSSLLKLLLRLMKLKNLDDNGFNRIAMKI